ncbi:MAG: hypothetical protein HUJ26_19850 [Planctomycetaceae bacterium]|nr:hypothetical protein [Planctomycetaceae bacterium]
MPKRTTSTKPGTRKTMRNVSYESLVVSWLMQDGWQVFQPILDHAHKTDILISDGPNFHRIQVKTSDQAKDSMNIQNLWEGSYVDWVVLFAKNSNWGYVFPAFKQKSRKLNAEGHLKFQQTRSAFLKAFHQL